jgi:hypothetical protein
VAWLHASVAIGVGLGLPLAMMATRIVKQKLFAVDKTSSRMRFVSWESHPMPCSKPAFSLVPLMRSH